MQLILVQSDIELALKEHINGLLTIREGMEITIDLKATRGTDGATAIIDISPVKAEPSKLITLGKSAIQIPTKEKSTKTIKDVEEPLINNPPQEGYYPTQQVQSEEHVEDNTTQMENDKNKTEEVIVKAKSLFEGLRKPKND